ncbi:MAG: fasciclin domain-containing protein [Methanomicrobiales archaeon]|nr:fasciclin domain-containing protein [Methanomicrobiales archaeon]
MVSVSAMQIRHAILILLAVLAVSALLAGCTAPPQGNATPPPTATTAAAGTVTETPTPAVRPSAPTVIEAVESDNRFTTLARVIREADTTFLRTTLSGNQSFTLFAPTDDAFDRLSNETIEILLNQPEGELTQLVRYHIVPGSYAPDRLPHLVNSNVSGLSGDPLTFAGTGGNLMVNGAAIDTAGAIQASNGYVYPIDAVLMRPNVTYTPTPTAIPTATTAPPNTTPSG